MADVKPLKLVDQGGGAGRLEEFGAGDRVPAENLPATEWTAETVSQAEAETGTATTRRAWTAERVRQAILGWWSGISSAWGRGFVTSADAAAGRTALGLGTAAVANVTTSLTDTTAGRVLRVGDWGLGAQDTSAVSDFGAAIRGGLIRYGSGTTGRPTGATFGSGVYVSAVSADGGYGSGIIINYTDNRAFALRRNAGSVSSFELYTTSNLTPNVLATYTLATLPSAAANPRLQVYCSNLTGQPAPVYSDGTNWRRVSDNTIAN